MQFVWESTDIRTGQWHGFRFWDQSFPKNAHWCVFSTIYSRVQKSIENWSVWSKMALGEVGLSLPWRCHALVLLALGYWRHFLNLIIFSYWKITSFRGILGQSWNSEISAILPYEIGFFSEFQLWPKIALKLFIFPLWKNYEI